VLAVLRRLDVEAAGDLDRLAVDGDDALGLVDLGDGERGQLAPAQAAVSGGIGHQLVPVAVRPGGECLAELGDVVLGRDGGGVDP
jgi:hypothetical protein